MDISALAVLKRKRDDILALGPGDAEKINYNFDTLFLSLKNLGGLLDAYKINIASANDIVGNLPVTNLNSGTNASATTFWRGDGAWVGVAVPTNALLDGSSHSDTTAGTPVRGDLIVATSGLKWAKFAVGATGTFLVGGTDPSWAKIGAISSTYFSNLSGANLTSLPAAQLSGTTIPITVLYAAGLSQVGTITVGTWNGTDIAVADGGTGLGAIADGSILAANTINVLSAITWHSAGTKILQNASGTISWADLVAGNTTITNDVATAATMYPTWVTANTGNLPLYVSSTKLSFVPSTGILTATGFSGPLTGNVTGDCSGTAGKATILATTRAIYGNNFDGSAALTGIIASTYGGTGNGFAKFTGPATAEKSFALPDANATILTSNAAVTVGQGGTGLTTVADGSILATNAADTLSAITWHAAGTKILTNTSGTISWEALGALSTDYTLIAPRIAMRI